METKIPGNVHHYILYIVQQLKKRLLDTDWLRSYCVEFEIFTPSMHVRIYDESLNNAKFAFQSKLKQYRSFFLVFVLPK